MKDLDGRPVQRDPTFLAESEIMVKHQVDRIMGDTARKVRPRQGVDACRRYKLVGV